MEWKTRGHDRAPGLHDALVSSGFAPDEPESIMIGEARRLAVDVALPDGVGVREVTSEPDVRAMCAMQAEVFGDTDTEDTGNAVLRRLAAGDGMGPRDRSGGAAGSTGSSPRPGHAQRSRWASG